MPNQPLIAQVHPHHCQPHEVVDRETEQEGVMPFETLSGQTLARFKRLEAPHDVALPLGQLRSRALLLVIVVNESQNRLRESHNATVCICFENVGNP
jgi:hypothetical protein